MEHQVKDVPEEGASNIQSEGAITYVDDRIALLFCAICVIIDVALIMGIISCVRHTAKWFVPH